MLHGFGGKPTDANQLGNREIAILGTYVLAQYGPDDTIITEQQVSDVRRDGPSSPLLPLARGGLGAGTAVVFLGAALLVF